MQTTFKSSTSKLEEDASMFNIKMTDVRPSAQLSIRKIRAFSFFEENISTSVRATMY